MQTHSDGIRLHFEVHGQGEPVLLVHGYPLSGRLWDAVVEQLAEDYRLIVPDLRGHGASEASPKADMGTYAEDLMAVLEAADEGRPVVLVGMSMGGYVCLELCRRHRERVRALALVDSRAEPDTPDAAEGRRRTAERVLREGSGVVAEEMAGKLFAPGAPDDLRAAWRGIMAATAPDGIAAALRAMADRPDSRPLLAELDLPVLVVVGAEDAITPPDGARKMAQSIGAPLELVAGAGHMTPVERPVEVAQALRRFLESLTLEPSVDPGPS
jgi:pimeloyl-ACP methyl ester carboxylesterase